MGRYDRHAIKAEISRTGSSLAAIAKAANIDPSACTAALRYPVPVANRAIAAHLGKPLHVLWPDWFDRSGNRRRDFNARTLRQPRTSRKARAV